MGKRSPPTGEGSTKLHECLWTCVANFGTRLASVTLRGYIASLMRRFLNSESAVRAAMLVLVCVLVWSAWPGAASAAEGTNAPVARPLAEHADRLGKIANEHTDILTFGLSEIPVLQIDFLGRPRWQYVAMFVYLVLASTVSKGVDWLIQNRLKSWAARTDTPWDDLVVKLLDGPVKVVLFVILLHIGLALFKWPDWLQIWVSKVTILIVAFAVLVVLLRAVDAMVNIWKRRHSGTDNEKAFNDQFLILIGKLIKGGVIVLSVLTTLDNLHFDIKAALASVSVVGLALGLAAQDTVANLFGAVSVFVDKPFQIGDRIRVGDVDGTVEEMGLRSTQVRSLDGFVITVPNKTIGNTTVTNITRRPTIKTELNFGVTYDTSADRLERAVRLLEEIFGKHPRTKDVVVTFNKFLDSALNIQVVHFWDGTDAKAQLADLQTLNIEVKRRFDAEHIEFAFPTQTVYHRPEPDWAASKRPA